MIDLLLHADEQLALWAAQYGLIVYGILFSIIFAETGLVVTPFLPGDSLLFAAGALAATGALRIEVMFAVLVRRGGRSAMWSTTRSDGRSRTGSSTKTMRRREGSTAS